MADPSALDRDGKAELRGSMRAMRRSITDRPERSARIWEHVRRLLPAPAGLRLMVYESIVGEPETSPFRSWCMSAGIAVASPEDGVDPNWPDVVIVPGLAFTRGGDRLGQGGGWYDRFLEDVRPECVTIGVGFAEQIVDTLPVERHDIALHHVVTELGDIVTPAP